MVLKYLFLICLILPSVSLAERKKPYCPFVGDLSTGIVTKSKNNFKCFTSLKAATKAGFVSAEATPTATPAPIVPNVQTFTGASDTVTQVFAITKVPALVTYQYNGTGHFSIVSYIFPDDYEDLLINQVGRISGQTRIYKKGNYYFEVDGIGNWEISVAQ